MSENSIHDVNIGFGDDVSKMLYEAARQSWDNRPGAVVEMHASFSGLRALRPDYKPVDCYEGMSSDGVGTKVEISERQKDHGWAALDLFAMACDDAVVRGAEPIAISTVLDVNRLDSDNPKTREAVEGLAGGYVDAARMAGVVILNGEVAELGDRVNGYGEFNYNWCATVLWYAHQDRLLTGHQLRPGDALIGLVDNGFRSNGITDVRKGLSEHYGPEWHTVIVKELGELSLGRLVQRPSSIYSRLICDLTGGFDIHREPRANVTGVAHITGGGQPSKLGRMLEPSNLGAIIDRPIEPPVIMTHVQKLRGFSDKEAYGKWHMGPGMVVATSEPDKVIKIARQHRLLAKDIGEVTEEPGIRIKNRGANQEEEWLQF